MMLVLNKYILFKTALFEMNVLLKCKEIKVVEKFKNLLVFLKKNSADLQAAWLKVFDKM